MSGSSGCLYQGRNEGPIRKCHRLSARADYYEQCYKHEEARLCHQQSAESLRQYLDTKLSATTRRQVELLLRRHQSRTAYLSKREEEDKAAEMAESAGLLDMSFSTDAPEDSAKMYLASNPAMLQDLNRLQVEFNSSMSGLQKLAAGGDVTDALGRSDLLLQQEEQNGKTRESSDTTTSTAAPGPETAPTCRKCNKTLEERLDDEDVLVKSVPALSSVWRSKDRLLQAVLGDYCSLTRSREGLREQVKFLTQQLDETRNQNKQLLACSNITFNTTATDPDQIDLSTSDTQEVTVSSAGGGGCSTTDCPAPASTFTGVYVRDKAPADFTHASSFYAHGDLDLSSDSSSRNETPATDEDEMLCSALERRYSGASNMDLSACSVVGLGTEGAGNLGLNNYYPNSTAGSAIPDAMTSTVNYNLREGGGSAGHMVDQTRLLENAMKGFTVTEGLGSREEQHHQKRQQQPQRQSARSRKVTIEGAAVLDNSGCRIRRN